MSYMLCGLKVDTVLHLPELWPWLDEVRKADIEIILGDVPDKFEAPLHVGPLLQTSKDGTCRYSIEGVANYLVEAGRRVTVEPLMAPDAPDVRTFLLGSVFGFLCHQRGLLPLHAGCVEIDGEAVVFVGHSGVGKSTLIGAFLRHGFPILADDVTVIDVNDPGGPLVLPSFPRIKLWRDALGILGYSPEGLARVRSQLDKFTLPIETQFRTEPLRLKAVYHLDTVNDRLHSGLERLAGESSLSALVQGVYRRFSAFRMGKQKTVLEALMQAAKVPGFRLARVRDLHALDLTVELIIDHRVKENRSFNR